MISIVVGKQGAGKTLYLVKKAIENKNIPIYSNFSIRIRHKKLTPEYFIDPEKSMELQNCLILIDEGQAFFDCRRSTSALNLILNFFVAQARKRQVEVYITTHNLNYVDIRLRYHATYFTFVKPLLQCNGTLLPAEPSKLNILKITPDAILATTYDSHGKPIMKEIFNPKPYFDYYDTREIIIPNWQEIIKQSKKLNTKHR